jgi:hypothetical protein
MLPTDAKHSKCAAVLPQQAALVLPVDGAADECHVCISGTFNGSWTHDSGEIDSCIVVHVSQKECVRLLEEAGNQ